MKKTTLSIEDVALALYNHMRLNEEFDYFITDRYKANINRNMTEINDILEKIADFPTQDMLFTLIENIQQDERRSGFIDGLRTGVRIGTLFDL